MRPTWICAFVLVGLTAACETVTPSPDLSAVIDAEPVRDWCPPGVAPDLRGLFASCSVVTRQDGERLATHRSLIQRARGD